MIYLDFWMIWGHPKSHQTEWDRKFFIHVDDSIWHLRHHLVGGIEACRPGPQDCHAEWRAILVYRRTVLAVPGPTQRTTKWSRPSSAGIQDPGIGSTTRDIHYLEPKSKYTALDVFRFRTEILVFGKVPLRLPRHSGEQHANDRCRTLREVYSASIWRFSRRKWVPTRNPSCTIILQNTLSLGLANVASILERPLKQAGDPQSQDRRSKVHSSRQKKSTDIQTPTLWCKLRRAIYVKLVLT